MDRNDERKLNALRKSLLDFAADNDRQAASADSAAQAQRRMAEAQLVNAQAVLDGVKALERHAATYRAAAQQARENAALLKGGA